MNDFHKPRSLFFPLLLVATGVFLFLVNIGTIEGTTWENVLQYWPVILIIGGLDGLYRRDGWVGPLVFLGLGTVLLLGNLHYLEMGAWALLLRLWPVLLVAIGLDIAFGHRGSAWNNLIRIGLGVVLIGAIVWLAISSPFGADLKSVDINQALENAAASRISLSIASGELTLSGNAPTGMLVTGTAYTPQNLDLAPRYSPPQHEKSEWMLDSEGVVIIPMHSIASPWDFMLTSLIPLEVNAKVAAGQLIANLAEVQLSGLTTEVGAGRTVLTLPCEGEVNASIQNAVGEIVLRIPSGCHVSMSLNNGLVSYHFPHGYLKTNDLIENQNPDSTSGSLDLKIDLAVGVLTIQEID